MISLYHTVSTECSKLITRRYSTSFSLGILFLHKRLRSPIYAIYGFVRLADEIVDSFLDHDRAILLARFKEETFRAIDDRISVNPVLHAFQEVVHQYQIEPELIEIFLQSMEMDLNKVTYSKELYDQYILGSAEVVGLMCLHIFTEGNLQEYKALQPYAMKLGAAFQKVNFLRDLHADYVRLGRMYFPDVDLLAFSNEKKRRIEEGIQRDFDEALIGIKKLPASSRGGVFLAYIYYKSLFQKIQNVPAAQILSRRIRISNSRKFSLMVNSMLQLKLNLL